MEDEDDDVQFCYRHPDRETALLCSNCERSICTDCSVAAPVGIKCPDCARLPRAARASVPTDRIVRAGVAAGMAAIVVSLLVGAINFGFFQLVLAYIVGIGIAEITKRASGNYRHPTLSVIAAVAAAAAFLTPLIVLVVQVGGPAPLQHPSAFFDGIAALVAAFSAYHRH